MTDKGADEPGWAVNAVRWVTKNARVFAAACGGMFTAAALVFNAGRDYQQVKSQLEINTVEIRLLRAELRELRTDVIRRAGGISP